jgi:Glycosyltransferases involved in cell wall biogenesis
LRRTSNWPALLYGVLLVLVGGAVFLASPLVASAAWLLGVGEWQQVLPRLLLASSVLIWIGLLLSALDLFVLLPSKRRGLAVRNEAPRQLDVTVALTAYNDEESIGLATADFMAHPRARRVIVVDNNSRDGTALAAERAGALVVKEERPGYGWCVYRALTEAMRFDDTDLTLLCEGDMTFRASDIDKFLAYIPHADIVNGTRIVEQLRQRQTQLSTFMYYGNFFVGKLLEVKHIGKGTFTDVGTTYKLCRNEALRRLLPLLNPRINLEFNAFFLDTALTHNIQIVECPVTFHRRVGTSKGGNVNNMRALMVGTRIIAGILTGWRTSGART